MQIKIIRTGGTIESKKSAVGLEPSAADLSFVRALTDTKIESDSLYCIDSSDASVDMITHIADYIRNDESDGFVITHGTDTMAYTAAALSFLLGNIGRPVIITGSMLPLGDAGSDAKMNLSNAVLAADTLKNSGVYILMNGRLIHGAKAIKSNTSSVISFKPADGVFTRFPKAVPIGNKLSGKIKIEYVTPLTKQIGADDAQAVLLCGYGSGNLPKRLKLPNKPCYLVSQCPFGVVDMSAYKSGADALKRGVIPLNMTLPAASMKLAAAYSYDSESAKKIMQTEYCGEFLIG